LTAVQPNDKRWFVGLLSYNVLCMGFFLVQGMYHDGPAIWSHLGHAIRGAVRPT
jgi:hypothetical protein